MQLQPFVSQLHFGMGRVGSLEHAEGPEGTQCALACAWAPFANELCEVGWAWTGEGGALQPGRGDFGGGRVHPVCRAGGLACPSGKDQRALT